MSYFVIVNYSQLIYDTSVSRIKLLDKFEVRRVRRRRGVALLRPLRKVRHIAWLITGVYPSVVVVVVVVVFVDMMMMLLFAQFLPEMKRTYRYSLLP